MLYVQLFFVFLWLMIVSAYGIVASIFRWGDCNLNHDCARLNAWGGLKILGLHSNVVGREHLEAHQPCVYVSNHQSGLDMLTMGIFYPPKTVLIGKKEVMWIPVFGFYLIAAGNVMIDRSNPKKAIASLQKAVERIKKNRLSVWIFPEGTRNRSGEGILPFKRGAFHMAIQAGIPIVPIVCESLKKIANWKEKKLVPGEVKIEVLPPIDVKGLTEKDIDHLISKVRSQMLEVYNRLSS